jgi:alpha-L-rhamnosidase
MRSDLDTEWEAKWIWIRKAVRANTLLCFTKEFNSGAHAERERRVHISADSRYRLLINGEWVHDGPARSFPWKQQFDTHDVTSCIRSGENRFTIYVHYWGAGTFRAAQYELGGLLFQMERKSNKWEPEMVSDMSWQVCSHPGWISSLPKAWTPLPFVEGYDASKAKAENREKFPIIELGKPDIPPWGHLESRSVPTASYDIFFPLKRTRTYPVRTPDLFIGFDYRPYLFPDHDKLHEITVNGFAACSLISSHRQKIIFYQLRDERCEDDLYLNGDKMVSGIPMFLEVGKNLLLCIGTHVPNIDLFRIYPAFTEKPVSLSGIFEKGSLTVFGPFEDWESVRCRVMDVRSENELLEWLSYAQTVDEKHCFSEGSPWECNVASEPVETNCFDESAWCLCNDGPTALSAADYDRQILFDFGSIQCGLTEFELTAPEGLQLDFDGFEHMEQDRIQPVWGCALRYITAEGSRQYTSFLPRGFRYLRLTVPPFKQGILQIDSLKVRSLCPDPPEETGAFKSNDPLLNDIWRAGHRTLDRCTQDTYIDCPSWEQVCWVGDARIAALVDYSCRGHVSVARRTLDLAAQSLERTPGMESHVPSARPEVIPVWSMLWVKAVAEHYLYTGDLPWLKNIYPRVVQLLRFYLNEQRNEDGLLVMDTGNLFEWSDMDWEGRCCVTHNSVFLCEALRIADQLAEQGGFSDENFRRDRDELILAINRVCWNHENKLYCDSFLADGKQSSGTSRQINILAMLYDIVPDGRIPHLIDLPGCCRAGMVDFASPFGMFFLLEAQEKFGLYTEMVETIRSQWGRMPVDGDQAFWEGFPEANLMDGWPSRSYCHVWSAGPVWFLSHCILGISPASPGFDHVRIEPHAAGLVECSGAVPTPHGLIRVSWHLHGDRFELLYSLPKQVTAELNLPEHKSCHYELNHSDDRQKENGIFDSPFSLPGGTEQTLRIYTRNATNFKKDIFCEYSTI